MKALRVLCGSTHVAKASTVADAIGRTATWALMVVVALASAGVRDAHAQDAASPNIVLIVSDYMGYSDIGPYGGTFERRHWMRSRSRACASRATTLQALSAVRRVPRCSPASIPPEFASKPTFLPTPEV